MVKKNDRIEKITKNLEELKNWLLEIDTKSNESNGPGVDSDPQSSPKPPRENQRGTALLSNDGLFTYVDEQFSEVFGYKTENLLRKNWQCLYTQSAKRKLKKLAFPKLKRTGRWEGELMGRGKNGRKAPHYLELTKTDEDLIVWRARSCPKNKEVTELVNISKKVVRLRKGLVKLQNADNKSGIYNAALEVVEKVLGFDLCILFLDKENTIMAKSTGQNARGNYGPFSWGNKLSSIAKKKQEVIRDKDLEKYSGFSYPEDNFKSFICVPLEGIGALLILSLEDGKFTDADMNLLQILANHFRERLLRAEVEGDLREQAIHDRLTGLYNRHYLDEILAKEVERAQRYRHTLSFLMLDINGFKEVNDYYSHEKGDEVLIEVANLIRNNLREPDTVIRYGGDEFLVLLPETGEGSEAVIRRLREKIKEWNEKTDIIDFPISFAIGSSNFDPDEELSVQEKITQADQNMYEDKKVKQ